MAYKGDKASQKEEGAEAELSVYRLFIRQLGLMLAAGPGAPGLTEYGRKPWGKGCLPYSPTGRNDLGGFGYRS